MKQHPNALIAFLVTGLATLIIGVGAHYGHHISAAAAAGAAGAVATATLYVGRRGVKTTLADIWNGETTTTKPRTHRRTRPLPAETAPKK